MAETTLEEAKRCPKCEQPGEQTNVLPAQKDQMRGTQNYEFQCRNERCKWYEEKYYVTLRPDGTIPDPYSSRNQTRLYPKRDFSREKDIVDALHRQVELEKRGGAEVRNPNA